MAARIRANPHRTVAVEVSSPVGCLLRFGDLDAPIASLCRDGLAIDHIEIRRATIRIYVDVMLDGPSDTEIAATVSIAFMQDAAAALKDAADARLRSGLS